MRDLERIQERKPFRLESAGMTGLVLLVVGVATIAFFLGSAVQDAGSMLAQEATTGEELGFDDLKESLGQVESKGAKASATSPVSSMGENSAKNALESGDIKGTDEDETLGAPTPTIKPALAINVPPAPTPLPVQEEPVKVEPVAVVKKSIPEATILVPAGPPAPIEQARYIPKATPAGGPAAAQALTGESSVKARPVRKAPLKRGARSTKTKTKGEFTLQIRAFREAPDATSFGETLSNGGYNAYVVKSEIPEKGVWYRVRIGEFSSLKEATDFQEFFEGNEGISTFVSPL